MDPNSNRKNQRKEGIRFRPTLTLNARTELIRSQIRRRTKKTIRLRIERNRDRTKKVRFDLKSMKKYDRGKMRSNTISKPNPSMKKRTGLTYMVLTPVTTACTRLTPCGKDEQRRRSRRLRGCEPQDRRGIPEERPGGAPRWNRTRLGARGLGERARGGTGKLRGGLRLG